MFKYKVTYTSTNEKEVWAASTQNADEIIQTQPNYYTTLSITKTLDFPYTLGQTLYYFDTLTDKILSGIVTDLNFISDTEVKVFVRFQGESSARLFFYPTETATLYTNFNDLVVYLGRALNIQSSPILPPIPAGLSATSITTTSFVLNWLSVAGATGYNVYKEGELLFSNLQGNNVLVSGLVPNMTLSMEVSALNIHGETERSAPLVVNTLAQLPSIPNGVIVANESATSLQVSWNPSVNATTYNVYLNNVLTQSGIVSTSVVLDNLISNTVYLVQVSAVNTGGETSKSSVLSATTNPPLPNVPTGLGAFNITSSTVNLVWNYVAGADAYNIYVDTVFLESTIDVSHTVFGLTPNSAYSIQVSSTNVSGESELTLALSVTTSV